MATAAAIRVRGARELRASLKRAGISMDELKDAHAKASATVAAAAQARAPRRSGALAASVRPTRQARRARVLAGRASVPYAGVIHYGWPARNISPQPFILQAARATEPTWTWNYQRDINRIVTRVRGA